MRNTHDSEPWKPHLGYSTNVHRSRDLAGVYRFLSEYTVPIARRVFGSTPAGLELHLNIASTRELLRPRARRELHELLTSNGLYLFSVNAYPLLDFHARRVKETVYRPSWREKARAKWTCAIGEVAVELAAEAGECSISTLGGCFRRRAHGPDTFRRLAVNYLRTLERFLELSARRGVRLVLAVEPEPETTFETCEDVADFVEGYLLPLAFARWKRRGGRERIEADVRSTFTVNIDTCHLSVLFLDPVASLEVLAHRGLRVGKVHVTNAIAVQNPYRSPSAYAALRAMDEPRYFHQFCAVDATGRAIWRGLDLNELPPRLDAARHPPAAEIRSHFHVPVYLKRYAGVSTTQADTLATLHAVKRLRLTRHLVLETYTWPILAGAAPLRQRLVDGISREYRWLLGTLYSSRGEADPPPHRPRDAASPSSAPDGRRAPPAPGG